MPTSTYLYSLGRHLFLERSLWRCPRSRGTEGARPWAAQASATPPQSCLVGHPGSAAGTGTAGGLAAAPAACFCDGSWCCHGCHQWRYCLMGQHTQWWHGLHRLEPHMGAVSFVYSGAGCKLGVRWCWLLQCRPGCCSAYVPLLLPFCSVTYLVCGLQLHGGRGQDAWHQQAHCHLTQQSDQALPAAHVNVCMAIMLSGASRRTGYAHTR